MIEIHFEGRFSFETFFSVLVCTLLSKSVEARSFEIVFDKNVFQSVSCK